MSNYTVNAGRTASIRNRLESLPHLRGPFPANRRLRDAEDKGDFLDGHAADESQFVVNQIQERLDLGSIARGYRLQNLCRVGCHKQRTSVLNSRSDRNCLSTVRLDQNSSLAPRIVQYKAGKWRGDDFFSTFLERFSVRIPCGFRVSF